MFQMLAFLKRNYLFYFWLCVYLCTRLKVPAEGGRGCWFLGAAVTGCPPWMLGNELGSSAKTLKDLGLSGGGGSYVVWWWTFQWYCLLLSLPPWILMQLSHRVLQVWDCAYTISVILGRCTRGPIYYNLVTVQLLEQKGGFCSLENMVLGVLFSTTVMN